MKINVIGTSGSGKSTFSRKLAERMGYPYIEMDALFWKANWMESAEEEFLKRLEFSLRVESWILDGNYHRTAAIKWRDADMVVWLDYSLGRTFFQAVRRAWRRSRDGTELWAGNRENFRRSFLSRDSIVFWTLKTYCSNRRRYSAVMTDPLYSRIRFVHLRSVPEAEAFIESLPAQG